MSQKMSFDEIHSRYENYYSNGVRTDFEHSLFRRIIYGHHVLDVGCGRGRYAIFAAKAGALVYAIDQSKVAIYQLAAYSSNNDLSISTEVSSIDDFDIPKDYYDNFLFHRWDILKYSEFSNVIFHMANPIRMVLQS